MKTVTLIDLEYDRDTIPDDIYENLNNIAESIKSSDSDIYFYVYEPGEFQTHKYYDNHKNVIIWLKSCGLDYNKVLFRTSQEDKI